ncbi:MAG: hypothetical protein OEW91_01680, partial [Acidimicrobiia bacterium]|nr:hypothetical protein [Acidimicrobiia bacterium]
ADASDEASVETTAAAATEQAVTRTFLYNAETATVDEFRRMLDEQAALIDPGAAKRLAPDDFSQAELPSPTCLDVPEGRVVSVTTGSIAGEPVEGFVVVDDATDALVTVIYSAGSCTLIE